MWHKRAIKTPLGGTSNLYLYNQPWLKPVVLVSAMPTRGVVTPCYLYLIVSLTLLPETIGLYGVVFINYLSVPATYPSRPLHFALPNNIMLPCPAITSSQWSELFPYVSYFQWTSKIKTLSMSGKLTRQTIQVPSSGAVFVGSIGEIIMNLSLSYRIIRIDDSLTRNRRAYR